MQKHEFEERIESTVSDEDYKLIEFVYQFHPVIRNVSGKDEVAELYKSFGMALLQGKPTELLRMYPQCEHTQRLCCC